MLKEFKDFAMRENAMDLAIGVILGGAFGKIISSFVSDILMPPIGLLLGKINFSNLYLNLSDVSYTTFAEARKAGAPTLNYGIFVNQAIDFTIVAFTVFLMIKGINKIKKKEGPIVVPKKDCPFCFLKVPKPAIRCSYCTSDLK